MRLTLHFRRCNGAEVEFIRSASLDELGLAVVQFAIQSGLLESTGSAQLRMKLSEVRQNLLQRGKVRRMPNALHRAQAQATQRQRLSDALQQLLPGHCGDAVRADRKG